ncbi:MAG: hypothetical protein LBV74_17695 [Tannerella sp.]|nr:hypothetical protein [Tannerella sp.]
MKKLVFVISFLISMSSVICCGQGEVSVREIYYQVDKNGNIKERKTLGERTLVYTPGRGLTKMEFNGGFRHNLDIRDVDVYNITGSLSAKTEKLAPVYDDQKRLVEYSESAGSGTLIKHFVGYNQYDDPIEIKSTLENEDGTVSVLPTMTFDYFYFCDVPNLKPQEKELDKYYRLGIILSKQGCPWMLRTVKKNGVPVQHAERKYRDE